MLSDNIKKYRKAQNMSQDELAQKLDISRQSVSLWENGQSQPTIDNIIALTKIFGISSDELLDISDGAKEENPVKDNFPEQPENKPKKMTGLIILGAVALVIILAAALSLALIRGKSKAAEPSLTQASQSSTLPQESAAAETAAPQPEEVNDAQPEEVNDAQPEEANNVQPEEANDAQPEEAEDFDLFAYCRDFAIRVGELNGDYCIYQQPSSLYGGYENEYFSVSYWGDSDMVEFCLHCPLDETYSINFYLRMRGGYDGSYEYLSSRYYRSDGYSVRSADGSIDPAVFNDQYPLNCDSYDGSAEGQDEFMEESRVGICDLIRCLKQFVSVEAMDCGFDAFGFVNF